ncbi:hypothetical protein QBC36DRAFT_249330 [Triangularia setosa]|uniref:PDZ-like domain-containing protein n=1 Tax=Triangularia setosa TaxID=2587417 RepID=A0AAN6VXF5_9PEZI|nr:hypothetical protein QBC36DRAFT_249330 [Podospora setosa]
MAEDNSLQSAWKAATDRVIRSFVRIEAIQPIPMDWEGASNLAATGFIIHIDKTTATGWILTNRLVIGIGPFVGRCRFESKETVDITPRYIDPVHDFGIVTFKLGDLKHMNPVSLGLKPNLAKVGTEIRVFGNDGDRGLAIFPGIISRIDANATDYGWMTYNDMNTIYIQCNSDAIGGSSGSPAIDKYGNAIAILAGGSQEGATNVFLPLDRPLRALDCLVKGEPVTRGHIGVEFQLTAITECLALGLSDSWERTVRSKFPEATSMLAVRQVIPQQSPLKEGDIFVMVNGDIVIHPTQLDDIFDSSVGKTVELFVLRNGAKVEIKVTVDNLHKMTPDRYVTFAHTTFHEMSLQQSRQHYMAPEGVVISSNAHSDISLPALLVSLNFKPIPNLEGLLTVVKTLSANERYQMTYYHLGTYPRRIFSTIFTMSCLWDMNIQLTVRDDPTGMWNTQVVGRCLAKHTPKPISTSFPPLVIRDCGWKAVEKYGDSFVSVECNMQYHFNGETKLQRSGFGVVVDASLGLVIVSRDTVPHDFSQIYVTFAGRARIEAKHVLSHSEHNYAFLQYDPTLVRAEVYSGPLSTCGVNRGDEVYFVGCEETVDPLIAVKTTISDIYPNELSVMYRPVYCAINFDSIAVQEAKPGQCHFGILVNKKGEIVALWLRYRHAKSGKENHTSRGFSVETIQPVLLKIQAGDRVGPRILGVQFEAIDKNKASTAGVPDNYIRKLESSKSPIHRFLRVLSAFIGEGSEQPETSALQAGDIVLEVEGKPVFKYSDTDFMHWSKEIFPETTLVRDGVCKVIKLRTFAAEDFEPGRVAVFSGAVLQVPHLAVRQRLAGKKLPSNVYISAIGTAAPFLMCGVKSSRFVTAIGDEPVQDLKSFLQAAAKCKEGRGKFSPRTVLLLLPTNYGMIQIILSQQLIVALNRPWFASDSTHFIFPLINSQDKIRPLSGTVWI